MQFYVACGLMLLLAVTYADHEHSHGGADHSHHYVVKTHEDLVKARDLCVQKVVAPAELVEKFKNWDFPNEEKARCYIKCFFEQFELFDEQHGFHVHEIHQQLEGKSDVDHSDQLHEKISNCADKNEQGSDVCTWAYRGGLCFLRNNLKLVKQSVAS